jgi:ribosome-associated protein
MTPAYRHPPGASDLPTDGHENARPSKTRLKREMASLQDLGVSLVDLDPARLAALNLPERLADAIALARGITRHEARRRQMQYVGRLMRDVDPAPIRAALERFDLVPAAEKARFAAIERWRERLLAEAGALDAFVNEHPGADRDAISKAIGAARNERARGEATRAFRELFRILRRASGDA